MIKDDDTGSSTSTDQFPKSSENDFGDITVRNFKELKETMSQVVSKALESMRAEVGKLQVE